MILCDGCGEVLYELANDWEEIRIFQTKDNPYGELVTLCHCCKEKHQKFYKLWIDNVASYRKEQERVYSEKVASMLVARDKVKEALCK